MKKQMSLFVWAAAVFGMSSVWAGNNTYIVPDSYTPGKTNSVYTQSYSDYKTSGVNTTHKRSELYKNYAGCENAACEKKLYQETYNKSETKSKTAASNKNGERKYYLAHPFFQPLKGKFGSVTDLSMNEGSYNVKITPFSGYALSDESAKWTSSGTSVKEDFSYGITDTISLIASARYSSYDYKMDWSLPETVDDKYSESGLDVWGIGAQWRFVDTSDWIATTNIFYQNNVDIAKGFIIGGQAGYKVGRSTIYGLARIWNLSFEGNSYGDSISDANGNAAFVVYKTGDGKATYIEGGAGLFSVLDKNLTLNLELVMGNYDWHNQGTLKAAIGWQPNDNFAVNLYAKTSIYDSANDKNLDFWYYDAVGTQAWEQWGTAKVSGYSETSFGLQTILYF